MIGAVGRLAGGHAGGGRAIDTFEQTLQRPRERTTAYRYYRGKKKCHTHKSQITVDEHTGRVVDVSASVPGPTADLMLLKQSGVLDRLPPGVGAVGDLAYGGIAPLHPHGLGATPRRKPRRKPRPAEDVAYNRACAQRRVVVEHTLGACAAPRRCASATGIIGGSTPPP